MPTGLLSNLLRSSSRIAPSLLRILFIASTTFAVCGLAQTQASKPEPAVTRATLDNGLRVVVVRSSLAPVVTTVMNYLVGSNEAPRGFPGTAHALEHMMFRGSPELSGDQLANIAAAMGGEFNAETEQSVTRYFFTVPKQDLDVALHIESIRMRDVLATDALWDKERGAIEQEVAGDLSNPEYVFQSQLLSAMFRGTPYEHDALGTRPSFDATPAAMLKKFHDTWYAPNNAILVIAGDVDPESAIATVKDLFGGIPAKPLPARAAVELEPVKPETLHLATDLPYGLAAAAFRWPGSNSPDFAAAQILADVLASQRSSFYSLVPQGKALSASFSFDDLPQASLAFAMAAFPAGGNGAALLSQIRAILSDVANHGVPADLVNAAKRHELADAESQKNSISDLAMLWSDALVTEGGQSPNDRLDAIEKVTVDDVKRAARRLLNQQESISAILTPQPSGQATSSTSFGKPESFAARDNKAAAFPSWAQKLNEIAIPVSNVHPQVTTLSNGLKLIVQPETASAVVSVFGHIRNGLDMDRFKGREGIDELLDELLSYGTTSLDRVAFQRALDNIGANQSSGTDFSLEVLAGDFDKGLSLLADAELHPALPAAAFKIIRRQLAESVAGELASPSYLAQNALESALLPKNDPALRHATARSISSLSLADVRNYYRRVFRPDMTTIVVIGNITMEQARSAIEREFGSWKAHGPKPDVHVALPSLPKNRASSVDVPNGSRVQADVTLAQTLPVTRSDPDYYSLNLGAQVLGGAFYAGRFFRDLRENTGLVYDVSSSLEAGPTRAFYIVNYGCDPQNVSKIRAIVERDLREMQTVPVSEQTLSQAKVQLLKEILLSEASVHSIAEGLIAGATSGLPLDEPEVAAGKYAKLTPQDVQAAFARWIRPHDFVQVTEGPDTN
jgi:zinc protease